jgi:methionyl-tRNA synthetase
VAPLRIETGRYENKNVNERVCFICHEQIEDEKHVLLDCPLYADLLERLLNEAKRSINQKYKNIFLLLKILKQVLVTAS